MKPIKIIYQGSFPVDLYQNLFFSTNFNWAFKKFVSQKINYFNKYNNENSFSKNFEFGSEYNIWETKNIIAYF